MQTIRTHTELVTCSSVEHNLPSCSWRMMQHRVATAIVFIVMPRLGDFIPFCTHFPDLPDSVYCLENTMPGILQSLQETSRIRPRPSLLCPSEYIFSIPACLVQ